MIHGRDGRDGQDDTVLILAALPRKNNPKRLHLPFANGIRDLKRSYWRPCGFRSVEHT